MAIPPPSAKDIRELSDRLGLGLTEVEAEEYVGQVTGALASYAALDPLVEEPAPSAYPRDGGSAPDPAQNPVNGWAWRCSIEGRDSGSLSGRTVAIKDNTLVAGLPMLVGTPVMEGFVATEDATVVTRLLDAGAHIVGKTAVPAFCFDGGGFVGGFDPPVLNPNDHDHIPGGSSSGSAAVVAGGEVDMALGGDQGGSIRLPASFSGCCGHKPTYGLVPYTGIVPLERTLDHVGPMARTVADCALMLEAIAGPDGLDGRQRDVRVTPYVAPLDEGVRGLRIGVLREGFGIEGATEAVVDEAVLATAHALAGLGATVQQVSVPMHGHGLNIWNAIVIQGCSDLFTRGESMGTSADGLYPTELVDFFARARREHATRFSSTLRATLLTAEYVYDRSQMHYYAVGRNLALRLRRAYDDALADVDVLVMPTTAMRAFRRPPEGASLEEIHGAALGNLHNVATFDVTGHPALSVPVPGVEGLPIGFQIVGRHFDDATVLRVGHAVQAG
ncbi:MAG: amidase [Solirubrobacteraceae bacterium]|jgi:amidase|nr:amidase [Solirubrobacteraceae bacterium]MEA2359771.1 amidase [Solirubrobacteraceae bacterium]